jgi:ammonium transporter, Amt family
VGCTLDLLISLAEVNSGDSHREWENGGKAKAFSSGSMAEAAAILQLQTDVASLTAQLDLHRDAIDTGFLLWGGSLVFLMQAGFMVLEIGSCSVRSTKNLLIKNLLDMAVGSLAWWAFGQGFSSGGNSSSKWDRVIGGGDFLSSGSKFSSDDDGNYGPKEGYNYALWFYQWAFAGAATTICSGAVGERLTLTAYFLYAWLFCAIIYSLVGKFE